jgi:hypothetical protein
LIFNFLDSKLEDKIFCTESKEWLQALNEIWQWTGVTPTLSYSLRVSQDKQSKTTWHLAALRGHLKTLEKLRI